jgi:quercetin dioxygenase-like cupin family protein
MQDVDPVEGSPGIFRRTLAYDQELMLCHFTMKKGAATQPHTHPAAQIGYVMRGKVIFHHGESGIFAVEAGGSYVFDPNESHAIEVLEEAEIIECFAPLRPELVAGA